MDVAQRGELGVVARRGLFDCPLRGFKLHFALIEGVNDAPRDIHAICDAVLARDLQVHVNLVRYNPPSAAHGRETPERVLEASAVRARVRVGVDVHASCGMFQLAGRPE